MPLKGYGVLKGKAVGSINGLGKNPHYQVLISDGDSRHRIAINVKSQARPSEVLYYVDESFEYPTLGELEALKPGFHEIDGEPGGLALDYIRGNHFDVADMLPLPHEVPGCDNDLNELVNRYMREAVAMEESYVYAFGQRWGPEKEMDKYFAFKPGSGIHDIHMNQGNSGQWSNDDGVWQDGGLIIYLPCSDKWVGVFMAFQSQCFHTDDDDGHRIPGACAKDIFAMPPMVRRADFQSRPVTSGDKRVRIVAARVNINGEGLESLTILNTTPEEISLAGWTVADMKKNRTPLEGTIEAGIALEVPVDVGPAEFPSEGGIISLLDDKGLKVDGVSYTARMAAASGWTMVF